MCAAVYVQLVIRYVQILFKRAPWDVRRDAERRTCLNTMWGKRVSPYLRSRKWIWPRVRASRVIMLFIDAVPTAEIFLST